MPTPSTPHRGFTLIELLLVISVIALLATLLFPVFSTALGKTRQTACLSNLRQLGMAVAMYAQDNDDHYPLAVDSEKRLIFLYAVPSANRAQAESARPLREELAPYVRQPDLWRCPSDFGFPNLGGMHTPDGSFVDVPPTASCFQEYGVSYFYRVALGLKSSLFPATGYDFSSPPKERDSSKIPVLTDATAKWHTGGEEYLTAKGRNVVFADGHAKALSDSEFLAAWLAPLTPENQ